MIIIHDVYFINKQKMKLLKILLWAVAIAIIPICTIVMADDCFDTIIDNGEVYYVDPFDKYSFSKDKEILLNIYWDKIKCNGEKKTYTKEEYIDKISSDLISSDLLKDDQRQEKDSWVNPFIELIMLILCCVATRKIFAKAWKPGINSIIPIYSLYEMSDIAGLSWLFKKAVRCLIIWFVMIFISLFVMPIALFPQIWFVLICIFWVYMCAVNFYIARNFWWSTIASILYVIFNPVAVLILGFWNDKYYQVEQKEKMKEMAKKAQLEEDFAQRVWENVDSMVNWMDDNLSVNAWSENNSQPEEDPIKYIDPNQFA